MSSNPAFETVYGFAVLSQPEVPPPASNILPPPVAQFPALPALVRSPHLPHPRFESFHALRRDSDLQFSVQSKAQELAFPNPPFAAFGSIHLQSQPLLNPVLYRFQRSLCRCLAAHIYVAVVGIPAEAMPSSFQFFVERVEIDVGKQWRQRSS